MYTLAYSGPADVVQGRVRVKDAAGNVTGELVALSFPNGVTVNGKPRKPSIVEDGARKGASIPVRIVLTEAQSTAWRAMLTDASAGIQAQHDKHDLTPAQAGALIAVYGGSVALPDRPASTRRGKKASKTLMTALSADAQSILADALAAAHAAIAAAAAADKSSK